MKRLAKLFLSGIIAGSMVLGTVSVFANNNQVVKVKIGSNVANVNGYNTTLNVAPYIQQPSESMMIPLRFVSTALGIAEENIQYNPGNKQITITNNGTTVKFIAGTTEMSIDGKVFDMAMIDDTTGKTTPIYTEIKNGSTFIPLRSLESAFGIKIDWENSTKTAILTNNTSNNNQNTTNNSKDNNTQNINSSLDNNSNKNELTEQDIRKMEEEVVKLVNEERDKYGLQPLEVSEKLMETARMKSEDMATRNYFSHTDPDGYNMAIKLNIGENIHAGNSTAGGAVSSWMDSDGHRDNILNPNYKYIGVGYAKTFNAKYITYWTQQFSF